MTETFYIIYTGVKDPNIHAEVNNVFADTSQAAVMFAEARFRQLNNISANTHVDVVTLFESKIQELSWMFYNRFLYGRESLN